MDAFGFYQFREDGAFNIIEFVVANLEGVCRELCPARAPEIVLIDERTPTHMTASIFYAHKDIGIGDPATGTQRVASNVFVVHQEAAREFEPIVNDINRLLIALWQLVLHEVRHFVQHQCFIEEECASLLLTEEVLANIARRNHGAAQCAYDHIKVYAASPAKYDGRKEIDAVINSILAVTTLIMCCDGEFFDFDKVRLALMYTMDEYRKDSSMLDMF